jgi:hypothetical protein
MALFFIFLMRPGIINVLMLIVVVIIRVVVLYDRERYRMCKFILHIYILLLFVISVIVAII